MRNLSLTLIITIVLAGCAVAPPAPNTPAYKPTQPTTKVQPLNTEKTVQTAATGDSLQAASAPETRPQATGTPEDARRHILRGMAAIEMAKSSDDMALAEDEFRMATEIAPQMGVAWFNLGKVQSQLGRYGDAIASYRQYLAVSPGAEDAQRVRDEIVKIEFKQEQAAKERERAGTWVGRDGAWYALALDGNRMTLKTDSRPVSEDECRSTYTLVGNVPINALVHAEYQLVLRGNRLTGTWSRGPVPADKCTIPPDTAEVEGELRDKDGMMGLRQERTSFKAVTQMSLLGDDSCAGVEPGARKMVEDVIYGPLGPGGLGVRLDGLTSWWDGGFSMVHYGWQGRLKVGVKEGSAAYGAGLRDEDEILAIDGVPVNSLNAGEAVRNLHGEVGTVVTLDIRRKGVVEPISLTVQRISLQ